MGYYTNYSLSVVDGGDYKTDYEEEIQELSGYGSLTFDAIKWYDHEKDMLNYSLQKPEVTFLLEGEGEETGDIWRKYFKNGKMFQTKAELRFEYYDESKLQ